MNFVKNKKINIFRLTDQIEMALFVLRYVCSLLIFAIGLRAPGIVFSTLPDYQQFQNDQRTRSQFYREVNFSYLRI